MTSVVILQARTNSTRLPAKVLLPIQGAPVVVLAAKRAGNTGRRVIVATSSQASDDHLAAVVSHHGIECYRGSLDNTLDRFVQALYGCPDDTIVFRLTADNVFPDGHLLDLMETEFTSRQLNYLCCNGESSGVPYGVAAEVTRLGHLRHAAVATTSAYDQEHVTPFIVNQFGLTYFDQFRYPGTGHLRCTIDCLDDYLSVLDVFAGVPNPVEEPLAELIRRLSQARMQPMAVRPTPKLVLGTAQLGSAYGIANTSGQPSRSLAQEIIKTAIINGVTHLDSARGYGESEEMIGHALKGGWQGRATVITKLSPLQNCPANTTTDALHAFVDASVYQSCAALQVQTLDVLMLHRLSHLHEWEGRVWQRLLDLRASKIIQQLGASVQNPQELEQALAVQAIEYIQLPFNILDWRWDELIPQILRTRASRTLTVHARSSLMQGLLPSTNNQLWQRTNVGNPAEVQEWLQETVVRSQRSDITDLCLAYVNAQPWIDGIAVGVENMDQLRQNILYFNEATLSPEQISDITQSRPRLGETTLNPALWKKASQ